MFTIGIKDSFAAAHRIDGYNGKCEELHGHNFLVEAFLSGDRLNGQGLLVDFKVLKKYLQEILETLDHTYLNEIPFFAERNSSAEYIAMYVYGEMEKKLAQDGVLLKEIRVWESEKAFAAYGR